MAPGRPADRSSAECGSVQCSATAEPGQTGIKALSGKEF